MNNIKVGQINFGPATMVERPSLTGTMVVTDHRLVDYKELLRLLEEAKTELTKEQPAPWTITAPDGQTFEVRTVSDVAKLFSGYVPKMPLRPCGYINFVSENAMCRKCGQRHRDPIVAAPDGTFKEQPVLLSRLPSDQPAR